MRTVVRSSIMACVMLAASAASLAADELRDAVERFLATGAIASAPNLSDAESQYLRLRARMLADGRLEYACAMVLLNQRKYANAVSLLARQVAQHPTDLEAGCWYVWALVQARRYRDALAAAEQIGLRIADADLAPEATRQKAALMLGKIFGYFERVRPSGLASEEITQVKNPLLARLPAPLIQLLDEGAALTATRFDELLAARQQKLVERITATEAAREKVAQALESQVERTAHSETERDAKAEEAGDAARQWSLLQRQTASLSRDRAHIAAEMMVLQALMANLNQNIEAGAVGSGTVSVPIQARAVSVDNAARAQQLALQLASLNKQAFDIDRKLLEYGKQAEALRATGEARGEEARRNEAQRQEAARRAELLDKRLRQLERDKPATTGLVTTQMRNLSTYLPFDYEGECVRVLGWFGDSP